MMKKVWLFILLTVSLIISVLAGCDDGKGSSYVKGDVFSISNPSLTLIETEEYELEAYFNSYIITDGEWLSENSDVATVENGVVKGVGVGETNITVKYNGYEATCRVIVKKDSAVPYLEVKNVLDDLKLNKGSIFDIKAVVKFKGNEENQAVITYKSNDESVVEVDDSGKITARAFGDTTIEIFGSLGEFGAEYLYEEISVSVIKKILISVNVPEEEIYSLSQLDGKEYNNTITLLPEVYVEDEKITDGIFYTVSEEDANYISVDRESGVVTGKRAGEATVYCNLIVDEKTVNASAKIHISRPVIKKQFANEYVFKIDDGLNVNSFTEIFNGGKEISDIEDVSTETPIRISVGNDGELSSPLGFSVGEKTFRFYNDVYAYDVDIVLADIVIKTAEEFKEIIPAVERAGSKEYIVLSSDIVLGEYNHRYEDGEAEFWFQGTLDGRGHKIQDAEINGQGLFYQIGPSGTVKNLAICNADATMEGILSYIVYGEVDNVYIEGNACGSAVAKVLAGSGSIRNTIVDVEYVGFMKEYLDVYGQLVAMSSSDNTLNISSCFGISKTFNKFVVKNDYTTYNDGFVRDISELKAYFNGKYPQNYNKFWGFDSDGFITFGSSMVERRSIDQTVGATALNYQTGKHELFSFAKNYDITNEYSALCIKEEKYTVKLQDAIDRVEKIKIGIYSVKDFDYDEKNKTISIPVKYLSTAVNGEYDMIITSGETKYYGKVIVADYVITSSNELRTVLPIVSLTNKYVVLGGDIEYKGEDYKDYFTLNGEDDWFNGTFDGRGYAIKNIVVKGYGLFKQVGPVGTVKNIAIINGNNTSENNGGSLVVGWNYGTIDNVYVSGKSSGQSGIATLSADYSSYKSKVSNCIANVHGTHNENFWFTVRGVVVGATHAEITNCYGISDNFEKGIYLNNETGDAYMTNFYNNTSDFMTAIGGVIPNGFNDYWTIKDGNLYFGNCLIIEK